jgi:dolichol-phosphate mannosyltransferase subunit 3
MARAHQVALIVTVFISIYLLAFFTIIPIPFLDEKVVQQILPVVGVFFPGANDNITMTN